MADSEEKARQFVVYLGLGSNLGDREDNLRAAVERLSHKLEIRDISPVYETEPMGYAEQPLFLNAALSAYTQLSPKDLLDLVKHIERDMGRKPDFQNAPRIIDIDILFYGALVVQTPGLIIPHPRITERAFVLAPLADIAGGFIHPELKRSIGELLTEVDGINGVRKLVNSVIRIKTP